MTEKEATDCYHGHVAGLEPSVQRALMRILEIFRTVKLLVYVLSAARSTARHDRRNQSTELSSNYSHAGILRLSGTITAFPEVWWDENRADVAEARSSHAR